MKNNNEETLHLIELYHSKGESVFMKALDDLFKKKDYAALKKMYAIEGITSVTGNRLISHIDWCNRNAITSAPTIYLNDKKIEKEYQTEDIEWLVANMLSDN
jgi:predicted N-acyltransferase